MMNICLPNITTEEKDLASQYRCDYLVIGSGPGGSVAGDILTQNGKNVIFLEDGPYYPNYGDSHNIGSITSRYYRDGGLFPILGKPSVAFVEGCCVGGGSVINSGLLWRTPPWILKQWRDDYQLEGYEEKDLLNHFQDIERRLHVTKHLLEDDANLDSLALAKGAERLNWKYVLASRSVKNCQNRNYCVTGCPSGAKQSMVETYLQSALKRDARLLAGLRAQKIVKTGKRAVGVIAETKNKKIVHITFDKLILACGAVQTPHILQRNRLSSTAGKKLEFHMNLRIVARFEQPIHADRGTIFTVQIQEFEEKGTLIKASAMQPHYLAASLSHFDNRVIDQALDEYEHYAIFVVQIKPKSQARIFSGLGDRPLVKYHFHPEDLTLMKESLRQAIQILFASSACELFLPMTGSEPIQSERQCDPIFEKSCAQHFQVGSIHAMASCPMGKGDYFETVDQNGCLKGLENIILTDASVLPSNIGESPQGTIMAFASEIISRHLSA